MAECGPAPQLMRGAAGRRHALQIGASRPGRKAADFQDRSAPHALSGSDRL